MKNNDTPRYEILPIQVKRGAYSASRYLYHAIKANKNDVIWSACSDINSLILNHISGIFIFDQDMKKEELEDINLKNWVYGKSQHGRCGMKFGVIFDENSYFLAAADVDSESMIEIAKQLCTKSAQKAVLVKDYNMDILFLVKQQSKDNENP